MSKHGAAVAVLLLAATVLAGCANASEETPGASADPSPATEVAARGSLRGVVVDDRIIPIVGANVTATAEGVQLNTTTLEDGSFGFDVEPGLYLVDAAKPGYSPLRKAVTVSSEEAGPVHVFQLPFDAATGPFASQMTMKVFLECSAGGAAVCALPEIVLCIVTGMAGQACPHLRDETTTYFIDEFFTGAARIPTHVQVEGLWDATQPAGEAINFAMWSTSKDEWDNGRQGPFFGNHDSPSPMIARFNETRLTDAEVGTLRGLRIGLFSGSSIQGMPGPTWLWGAVVNQDIDLFVTAFYGYAPPEEWTFVETGEVPQP